MTVTTMLWPSNGTGDGTLTGYTDVQTQRFFRQLFMSDPTVQGVIAAADNELVPSASGTSEITVGTGAAFIYGIHLYADAATVLTLPSVAADTGGIVYAAIDWVTQTGEINVIQNTSGNTAIPSLTQTALTEWQIPICSYVVNSSGTIYTNAAKTTTGVTDLRRFVGMSDLRIEYRQGGSATVWATDGSTNYRVNGSDVKVYVGSQTTGGGGNVTITFPVAFTYLPIVLATAIGSAGSIINLDTSISTSQCTINTIDADGVAVGSVQFNWMAIGV